MIDILNKTTSIVLKIFTIVLLIKFSLFASDSMEFMKQFIMYMVN